MMTIEHPLLETIERAQKLGGHMAAVCLAPEGEDWHTLQVLVSPSGEILRDLLGRVGMHYKTENRRVTASLFFGDYAFAILAVSCACYLLERRVPRLTTESFLVRFDADGEIQGVALNDYTFAALADDAAADHADCMVVESTDALQEFLLQQASECLQPLTKEVRANSTLGIPAMWALAADYTASAATYVGRSLKQEGAALALARQLSARQSPLRRKRDFIHIEECGLSFDMVDRVSCCLYYQVEDGHYCSTCPHRPMDERIERIRKWLADTAAKQTETN